MVDSNKIEQFKKLGNEALAANKCDEAIDYYGKAIEMDPRNHILWSNRSAAFAKKGDFGSALRDAEKTIELAPNWSRGYSRKGASLHGLGKYEDAIEAYRAGLKIDPNNESFQNSIEQLNSAMRSSSSENGLGDPGNYMNHFTRMFDLERWNVYKNMPQFKELADDPEFHRIMGEIRANPSSIMKSMNDPRILKYMEAVLSVMGLGADRRDYSKTNGHEQPMPTEGEREKPREEKPREEKPELTEEQRRILELKNKGNAEYMARRFQEADRYYQEALDLDPLNFNIRLNRAAVMIEQSLYDEAIEYCKELLEEESANRADFKIVGKTLARIGNVYFKQEKYAEAIEYYNKSLTEHRDAAVLKSLRDAESKKAEIEKAAYINVDLAVEAKELGNSHFRAGRYPEAIQSYTEAIRRDPSNPLLLTNRAATYIKLGAWPSAIKDCDAALELDPKLVKAYLRKGQVYLLMKDYSNALKTYDQGLKVDPNNQELMDGLNKSIAAMNDNPEEGKDETPDQILEKAMRNPEVRKILEDPAMHHILEQMSTNPNAAREHLKNPEIARRISLLRAYKVVR